MAMFGHHDARYNCEMIIKNLILLQDHYAIDPCADCITKHLETIEAYAEEGLTLDNADKCRDYLIKAQEIADKHKKIVLSCTVGNFCNIHSHDDLNEMIQEIRELRKEMNMAIYGIVGEVAGFGEHNDALLEEHEHEHELPS